MSALPSGWGFRDAEALERIAPEPKRIRMMGRYVSARELAEYADSLATEPTHQQVMDHFKCSSDSAYRYRSAVRKLLASR